MAKRDFSFIKQGAKVYWKDPADETSGYYIVDYIRYEDEDEETKEIDEDTIILISTDYSEAEVLASELHETDEEHICPICGSANTRYFLDVTKMGDNFGWCCNECGYEGIEPEFTE